VTGLVPKRSYQLLLASRADGSGKVEPLANFVTNPAGSAIVNAVGPIRQVAQGKSAADRRWLAIREGTGEAPGRIVQTQLP
jgi:hypothetical protein